MEGMHTPKNLLRPGDWLAKVDLKDAYFSIPTPRPSEGPVFYKGRQVLPIYLPSVRKTTESEGDHLMRGPAVTEQGSSLGDSQNDMADLMRRRLAALERQGVTDRAGSSSTQGELRIRSIPLHSCTSMKHGESCWEFECKRDLEKHLTTQAKGTYARTLNPNYSICTMATVNSATTASTSTDATAVETIRIQAPDAASQEKADHSQSMRVAIFT